MMACPRVWIVEHFRAFASALGQHIDAHFAEGNPFWYLTEEEPPLKARPGR